ncbi:MAG: nucleotidyltransferase domain-containing protein [Planctomycetes bacterium]|nr:nucleotidyltransferase domain-containing protein [Planctomycetota bacterium]
MEAVDTIRWLNLSDGDIRQVHAAAAKVLRGSPEVVAAYHYGSSARRQPARDIDLALVVERDRAHALDTGPITEAIAAECGRPVDDFDVRIVNDADPVFLGNLLRDGQRCYEGDRDARVAFEVRAMNAWRDFRPAWERMRRRVLELWSRG